MLDDKSHCLSVSSKKRVYKLQFERQWLEIIGESNNESASNSESNDRKYARTCLLGMKLDVENRKLDSHVLLGM